ncbi:transposase family protein [Pseudomonas fulva]|uniref:DDE-type integrase/transposase/recombinase n=1 Tax=Pseudomonas fulva TaxID=47880 RepID=UPI0015E2CFFD|nr:DDE-type integrase/transposase/recombinase [Pseudomonas fulva]MBA1220839.1 transposase family protein [Pseudomonas fulva]MBN4168138.1 transposase family protein [Pseudomonas fulva]
MSMVNIFTMQVGEQWRFYTEVYMVIAVDDRRAQLRSMARRTHIAIHTLDRLRKAFERGNLFRMQDAPLEHNIQRIVSDLRDDQRRELDKRLLYVRSVEEKLGGRLSRPATLSLIREIAEQIGDHHPPCYSSMYGWMRLYRESGGSPLALIRSPLKRRRRLLDRQPAVIAEIIDHWVRELYFIDLPHSIVEITDVIQCSLEDLNSKRPITDQLRVPSNSTIWRIIQQYDTYEKDLAQLGRHHAIKRQKFSRKSQQPIQVLERVECDTQVIDVMAVNNRGAVIGRAWLTVLIDVRSRMIIGWDISINPPCIEKTLRALKNSLSSDGAATGLASTYVMDNGSEFAGKKIGYIMHLLGSKVVYCEPYTPDQKPFVERWFKTHNIRFAHHLSGTTFSNPDERGDYDSEKNATYTIAELKEGFGKFIDIYHQDFHRTLNDSPLNTWNKLLDPTFPPKRYSTEDIQRLLWSKTTALPCSGRIGFSNLQWTGPAVPALATRGPKKTRLTVFYDITDLGTVWISHPDRPEDLFPLEAVDPDYQNGLTMQLHRLVVKQLRSERKTFDFKSARERRVRYILALRDDKGKAAQKRLARLAENQKPSAKVSVDISPSLPAHDQAQPPSLVPLPPITLLEGTPLTPITTVQVRHE